MTTIESILPVNVIVQVRSGSTQKVSSLGLLRSKTKVVYSGLREGDLIAFYNEKSGNLLMEPIELTNKWCKYTVGGIGYDMNGQKNLRDLTSDIPDFYIQNDLNIPIDIYYEGKKIAQLCGKKVDDHTESDYKAGYGSTFYFDNWQYGMDLGQTIGYAPNPSTKPFITAILNRKMITTVHIGSVIPSNGT